MATQFRVVKIIGSAKEWDEVNDQFRASIGDLGVIGLDCEWVEADNFDYKEKRDEWRFVNTTVTIDQKMNSTRISNGSQGKVALLEMASDKGFVVLVRLCLFETIPDSLRELVEDTSIYKLGVNIEKDATKLFKDWEINMTSFVDLRNIVVRYPRFLDEYEKTGLGLKKLGNFLANFQLDESKFSTVRFSHWAAYELTPEQIEYAKNDALMGIDGLICFAKKYMDDMPDPGSHGRPEFIARVRKALAYHLNRTCPDYVSHVLDNKTNGAKEPRDAAAVRKAEEKRRRRRMKQVAENESDSDFEFQFERWKQSSDGKRTITSQGVDRAAVFRDDRHTPRAAIDAALLDVLKHNKASQILRFDAKNQRGEPVFDVRVNLRHD